MKFKFKKSIATFLLLFIFISGANSYYFSETISPRDIQGEITKYAID